MLDLSWFCRHDAYQESLGDANIMYTLRDIAIIQRCVTEHPSLEPRRLAILT